jgi:catechol 2,3-dioxygenase-like lactoylglutathione lyase family enzyme
MFMNIIELNHVQVTVTDSAEAPSKHFYRDILGLEQIHKPDASSTRGAWYRIGSVELHLSVEDAATENHSSKRHVCFVVSDVAVAETHLRESGIEILPDKRPIQGWKRFYVRDPGGNRIEVAQRNSENRE